MVAILLMSSPFLNEYLVKTMLGDAQPNVLPAGDFDRTMLFAEDKEPHRFSFSQAAPYSSMTMISSGKINLWEVKLPKIEDTVFKLYLISIAPFIWLITFLRLREKQL